MEKIVHFFECLLPTSNCNLECEYCYLIQENRREMRNIKLDYDADTIVKALRKERVGGVCYFSLCGTGETMLQMELVDITKGLLAEGHYVNITTNGTISKKFDEMMQIDKKLLKHLNFSFSFHYLELKKKKLIDTFFENVHKVKNNGCSFIVQLNLYDGYLDYVDEIKEMCKNQVGAYPQLAATRLERKGNVNEAMKFHTEKTDMEYKKIGKSFESPLFEFTCKNFNKKMRNFCYAGLLSSQIIMKTGQLNPCYEAKDNQFIFDDIDKPIEYKPVGRCRSRFCVNSTHFISLGVMPTYKDAPTYCALRNREEAGWINDDMKMILSQKLSDNNCDKLKKVKKIRIYAISYCKEKYEWLRRLKWKIVKRIKR